jgi:hypothetical protein
VLSPGASEGQLENYDSEFLPAIVASLWRVCNDAQRELQQVRIGQNQVANDLGDLAGEAQEYEDFFVGLAERFGFEDEDITLFNVNRALKYIFDLVAPVQLRRAADYALEE